MLTIHTLSTGFAFAIFILLSVILGAATRIRNGTKKQIARVIFIALHGGDTAKNAGVVGVAFLLGIILFGTPVPVQLAAGILAAFATDIISRAVQKLCVEALEALNRQNAVAGIELKSNGQTLSVWFVRTGQEWPVLYSEIGMNGFTSHATAASDRLVEDTSDAIRTHRVFDDSEFSRNLTESLLEAGVTHSIDVEGLEVIPELHNFLETALKAHRSMEQSFLP